MSQVGCLVHGGFSEATCEMNAWAVLWYLFLSPSPLLGYDLSLCGQGFYHLPKHLKNPR